MAGLRTYIRRSGPASEGAAGHLVKSRNAGTNDAGHTSYRSCVGAAVGA